MPHLRPFSLVAQLVKNPPNPPAMREAWVPSLGWEDPLQEEKAPTPVFWSGEFHGLYSPWGRKESDTPERLSVLNIFYVTSSYARKALWAPGQGGLPVLHFF